MGDAEDDGDLVEAVNTGSAFSCSLRFSMARLSIRLSFFISDEDDVDLGTLL